MIKFNNIFNSKITTICLFASLQVTSAYSQEIKSAALVTQQKSNHVKGIVIDSRTNKPVAGARVTYGVAVAKLTDNNGAFEVDVNNSWAVINVSMDGYIQKSIPVVFDKPIQVKLYPIGYSSNYDATETVFGKNDILHSAGAVQKAYINAWEQNSETITSYLQGKMSGVQVIRKSGTPSMGANLFVRNIGSLFTQNQPLYIIDGVVYNAEMLTPSITSGHENNPLQHIDLRDIQDVTVLKDAVSTAIYGARAANGVVVINTTHANELATKIDFQATTGYNFRPKSIPMMKAYNYRSYLNDVLATSNFSGEEIAAMPFNIDNPNFSLYPVYHNETNWQDKALKNSLDQNYYLRVTGGDNIANYALSVGYNSDKGIIDNTKQDRYSARFNSDMRLANKLSAQTNISVGYGQQALKDQGLSPKTNPIFLSMIKAPFLNTNDMAADGTISPNYAEADYFGLSNPMQLIFNGVNNKKAYRFHGSINFDYKFNNSFTLSNVTAVTYDKAQENFFIPKKGVAKDTVNNMEVYSRLGTQVGRYYGISNDIRLSYQKELHNELKVQAIGGFRYHQHDAEQDYAMGYNSATDQLVSIGNSTASSRSYGGYIGKWANQTLYALSNVTFKNRYILNAALSLDGSSRFGSKVEQGVALNGHKYGVFPAVGAAWILSNEDFLKGSESLNLAKLRVSYGIVGNDDIGNFNARDMYASQNFLGVQGLVRDGISNPYLQWENVEKINAGLDLSFAQERINLTIDVYRNSTKDMLSYNRGNTVSGVAYYLFNNGRLETKGLDLGVFGRIVDSKVKWDANLTMSHAKSKVISLPETAYNSYAGATMITRVGDSPNAFYGYTFEGVYSTSAEASADGLGILNVAGDKVPFKAGDAKFSDRNGDKIINEQDRTVIGNSNPVIYGGLNNAVTFKNWKFGALVTYSLGNDVYNYTRAQLESGSSFYNQTELLNNRWKAEGQITNVPKAAYNDPMGNARFSDRWIEDGSYLRLRQVSVEYMIPVDKAILKYVRIYGTANNLLTFTKYLGYDPEFAQSADILNQGIDVTLEPQFRSFQLGVRLGL
ncbi:SusC/RagA family TonB-linked outer membrane protein [Sphingobacterium bovistauri]|uniref:SusC/RagA family TonB-linked outer membrane protein n=1 Tax=Sphingobacterium bovistauri TaxID=2781959 RepID=A0ABS7Z0Z0_9SPHI|nr:SusC/RagA family TonB-linked outer membrane protein [Sphingobacterium bovistauri]MCA5003840.1 SusC/RagA family TonB-linked outer membrane protein [Sphingobacterium bovistauri]